jgi:hypothetical protein
MAFFLTMSLRVAVRLKITRAVARIKHAVQQKLYLATRRYLDPHAALLCLRIEGVRKALIGPDGDSLFAALPRTLMFNIFPAVMCVRAKS